VRVPLAPYIVDGERTSQFQQTQSTTEVIP
jgi:hypothetical protein